MKNFKAIISLALVTSLHDHAQLNPIQLGSASNVFTVYRENQNQVYADNETGLVAFIHRQDIFTHGGTTFDNGRLRFDISFDKGLSFQRFYQGKGFVD